MPHLEFSVGPEADDARFLCLAGLKAKEPLEIWWAGDDGEWSPYRRARWIVDPQQADTGWGVPLDVMPHWKRGAVRRLRVVFRETGLISLDGPQFYH